MRTYESYKSDVELKVQTQNNFSTALNYYMNRDGVRQQDLMDDLNLSSATVSAWVNGKRMPRPAAMKMLAEYFQVSDGDMRRLPASVLSDKYDKVDIDENLRRLTHMLSGIKPVSMGGVELPQYVVQNVVSAIKASTEYTKEKEQQIAAERKGEERFGDL